MLGHEVMERSTDVHGGDEEALRILGLEADKL